MKVAMPFALEKTPARVKVRVWRHNGFFYVLRRLGNYWQVIGRYESRNEAAGRIEQEIRLMEWATEVKIRASWVCERCGELNIELLEAHHIKPKSKYPKLMYEVSNGRCLCLWCHAAAHWKNPKVRQMILARLGFVLGKRTHPKDRKIFFRQVA